MSPKVRRKNAEQRADRDDMLADWLERDANIMSLRRYQEDTRYNKIHSDQSDHWGDDIFRMALLDVGGC